MPTHRAGVANAGGRQAVSLIEKHQLARECACLARGSSSLRTFKDMFEFGELANVKDGHPKPGVGWRYALPIAPTLASLGSGTRLG